MPTRAGQRRKSTFIAAVAAVVVLVLGAGCTTEPAPTPTGSTTTASSGVAFNFGTGARPTGLDPALVNDNESYRVTRQVLEGLLTIDPVTGNPAPSLATAWKVLDNGLTLDFTLRDNVKFQDGTDFNASAVCSNFDRWYNLPLGARGDGSSVMFAQVFRAFSDDSASSIFDSCTATDDSHVSIKLKMALTGVLEALTMPAFAISSPAALKKGTANILDKSLNGNKVSVYGLHPVGTGPYTFVSSKDGVVTMNATKNYWGTKGEISTLKFITYADPQARLAALETGDLDGFDPVTPGNFDKLIKAGQQVLQRDPFSVMYVALNQANPVMKDLKVRQAIAAAIDKTTLANNYFIAGTATTAQFIPPKLSGFNNAVEGIGFDPVKAKSLLADSSYKGEELKFYYPTDAALSYLPSPEKVYAEIAKELTAVGFNIKPVPIAWNDGYIDTVTSKGEHALSLMGWNGSYSDPDNFVGPLFGSPNAELGLEDPALVSKITRARSLPNGPERSAAYDAINKRIAQSVPAVPIVFPISALALSDNVASYPLSPVLNEVFNHLTLSKSAKK